jgi:hypothetical protein
LSAVQSEKVVLSSSQTAFTDRGKCR